MIIEGLQCTSIEKMRMDNARSILRLIHEEKFVYRKTLAAKTKLASQTITNIVTILADNQVLGESSMEVDGRGRNPILLQINYSAFYIISVEITARNISCFVNDLTGRVCSISSFSVAGETDVLFVLKEHLITLTKDSPFHFAAIVCSVEGIVDSESAVVVEAKNLGWFQVDLRKELAEFQVPVFVIHDMGLLAYCEKVSSEKKGNHMILSLGNGVGTSFVIDQAIIGTSKMVGQLGHYSLANTGENRSCFCGKSNCLTQFVSKAALERTLQMPYHSIVEVVKNGSDHAIKVIQAISDYLAPALINLITILDLNKILITGSTIEDFGYLFLDDLEQKVKLGLCRWNRFSCIQKVDYPDFPIMCSQFLLDVYFRNVSAVPLLWDSIFVNSKYQQEGYH